MELRHLRYFVAVAEERSFLQAARRLRVAQPALSKQVRDLEHELGVALFERLPRGVRLTPSGQAFLGEARSTLDGVSRAVTSARGASERGRAYLQFAHGRQVAYAPIVADLLAAFRRENPEVELEVHNLTEPEQRSALRDRQIDLAVSMIGAWPVRGFNAYQLLDCRLNGALLPAGHPLAGTTAITLADLRNLTFLFPEAEWPDFYRAIQRGLRERGFPPRRQHDRSVNLSGLVQIAAGNSWTLGNDAVAAQYCRSGAIVFRPFREAPIPAWLALLWRPEQELLVQRFVDVARRLSPNGSPNGRDGR